MLRGWADTRSRPFTLLLGLLSAAFVLSIILYPDQAFQSSLRGLKLWWEIVFPALLPFMIAAEIMTGQGAVHGLGTLLEPLMRRAFRLPGSGGWALAAGMTAGYPLGASITARLRRKNEISGPEAERLLSISHLASPMLMVGVIGAGFLHSPETGFFLALVHYATAFLLGVWNSFHAKKSPPAAPHPEERQESLAARAYRRMLEARNEDGRAFGKLMGDAVFSSIQSLLLVGGFIMIFSVAVQILELQAVWVGLAEAVQNIAPALLEPHLGSYGLHLETGLSPALQAAGIGAVLAWSGFSLHAQAWSMVLGTALHYKPFISFRFFHAVLSFAATFALWEPFQSLLNKTRPAFFQSPAAKMIPEGWVPWKMGELIHLWAQMCVMLSLLLLCMLMFSLTIRLLETSVRKIR